MKMTGKEMAKADGIKFFQRTRPNGSHFTEYQIPCPRCGFISRRRQYNREMSLLCDYCKDDVKRRRKALKDSQEGITETKEEKRFRMACEEIKKQVKNFDGYSEAISTARKRLNKYGSIPEAMVAIELLRCGYRIAPQQKIKGYIVDFCLPEEKVVIEVDGQTFHHKLQEKREETIQDALGRDWRIIHIPAEKIRKRIRKVNRIIKEFKNIWQLQ